MLYKIEGQIVQLFSDKVVINNKTVTKQDKVVKAFSLFLQSENQIISKDEIMKELWDELIVSDDSLFKVIQEIRKILTAQNFHNDTLVNIYGRGYKINPAINVFEGSATPQNNSKNRVYLIFVVVTMMAYFIYLIVDRNIEDKISQQEYLEYKKFAEIDPDKVRNKILAQYSETKVSEKDKIKRAYLFAFADFKKGHYSQSLIKLHEAIDISNNSGETNATADVYMLLGLIHYYQDKYEVMKEYIFNAKKIFHKSQNSEGLLQVEYYLGLYYFGINDLDTSIRINKDLLQTANNSQDIDMKFQAYARLIVSYYDNGQMTESEKLVNEMLKLALEHNNSAIISLGYGWLTSFRMNMGDYVKAMNQAELTVRYAIDQPDTNQFQQSFSRFYNILNVLGHRQLAEKYLSKAIVFQNNRNSDGHLDIAELNLGIIYLQGKEFDKAQGLFEAILEYPLSRKTHLNAQAWLAMTKLLKQDNISAYSLAKEVYEHPENDDSNKLIAGASLVLSDFNLERIDEAQLVLGEISKINMDYLLIEKAYYLDAALMIYAINNPEKYSDYLFEKEVFSEELKTIKQKTRPSASFLMSLDEYLYNNSKPN